MARKRKRKAANRDHRAVSLKGARTRETLKRARGVSRPKTRTEVLREKARRMVETALLDTGGAR
jgi:hypothetical protein